MLDHINRIKSLHDQLREMGIKYDDKELAMTLQAIASLPESYNPLITALDAVGEDTLTFQKIKRILLNDADRISDTKKDEDAYTVQRPAKGKGWKPKEQSKNDNNNQSSFRELAIPARREDILPAIVHSARRIIMIISTKVRGQPIVLRKARFPLQSYRSET